MSDIPMKYFLRNRSNFAGEKQHPKNSIVHEKILGSDKDFQQILQRKDEEIDIIPTSAQLKESLEGDNTLIKDTVEVIPQAEERMIRKLFPKLSREILEKKLIEGCFDNMTFRVCFNCYFYLTTNKSIAGTSRLPV